MGRITASKFGAVSRAKNVKPTCSLANTIMQKRSFDSSKVPSLNWGIINESVARDAYLQRESSKHNNLVYQPSGLHVHRHYSYLAASPDGLISCKCWGGRVSDEYLTQNCGFLNLLEYEDTVLADRSFNISEDLALFGATLAILTKGKSQLSQQEVECSQKLAKVQIHVESLGK